MPQEIERKFLIRDPSWRNEADAGTRLRQFYLAARSGFSLRVRVEDEQQAVLTLKTGAGQVRGEFEYAIPLTDARDLETAHIGEVIQKTRYRIDHGGHGFEVDVFAGTLAPLVLAEVETATEDAAVVLPPWIGREVTHEPAFTNARLALDGLPDGFDLPHPATVVESNETGESAP